jgi:hypothetical protein
MTAKFCLTHGMMELCSYVEEQNREIRRGGQAAVPMNRDCKFWV